MRRIILIGSAGLIAAGLYAAGAPSAVVGQADGSKGELRTHYGIQADPAPGVATPVDEATARTTVLRELPLVAQGTAGEASLVVLTDHHYGPEVNGMVVPKIADRMAWRIDFHGVQMFVSGPWAVGRETRPATYETTVVAFVDATTGKFLEAVTL